eukprot:Pgem_evm1s15614
MQVNLQLTITNVKLLALLSNILNNYNVINVDGKVLPVMGKQSPNGDYLLLSQSWNMEFCCNHFSKAECTKDLEPVLGLHGLWPQYVKVNQSSPISFPEFCDGSEVLGPDYDYSACTGNHKTDAKYCEGGSTGFPCADILPGIIAPGYCGKNSVADKLFYLANHEYPKHGVCMGLTPTEYFNATLKTMKKLPHAKVANKGLLHGTPQYLHDNAGKCVNLSTLKNEFEKQVGVKDSVQVVCNADCYLTSVITCWEKDAINKGNSYVPGLAKACEETKTDPCGHCKTGIKLRIGYEKGKCQDITC